MGLSEGLYVPQGFPRPPILGHSWEEGYQTWAPQAVTAEQEGWEHLSLLEAPKQQEGSSVCVGGRGRGCSWIWGSEMISGSRSLDLEAMESLPLSEWNVRFRMPKNGSGVGARGSQGCLPHSFPKHGQQGHTMAHLPTQLGVSTTTARCHF